MNSVCISNCVNDTHIPKRPTYVNLHRWPESDAEFIKSVTAAAKIRRGVQRKGGGGGEYSCTTGPRVVDSISCRQMYLRSYTFSKKKETVPEMTKKCFGKVKKKVVHRKRKIRRRSGSGVKISGGGGGGGKKCMVVIRRVKEISCYALYSIFHRLLSCTATVDVADHRDL